MEKIKGYIIRLEDFEDSRSWSQHAYDTGVRHGWPLSFFPGTNGRTTDLSQHGINIYPNHKKGVKYMQRPGTQGCFLSHWRLWNQCAQGTQPMAIFEHDVEFLAPPRDVKFQDVIKFEGFRPSKPIPAGQWWEGARAYAITPQGAAKIVAWVHQHGAMPADWMLCDGIVDVVHNHHDMVRVRQNKFSFTRDLV